MIKKKTTIVLIYLIKIIVNKKKNKFIWRLRKNYQQLEEDATLLDCFGPKIAQFLKIHGIKEEKNGKK